ncbi:MAG: nicotinate (nicotinamide) nucleotide adenylyltransferase [Candidatus Marinimicrobia bacterium]|nr:nicotinate (nicotinamide) nucleotide adenylyltransferase [Candidatus Neomarinimicrobiota bacterium]
MSRVGIFGGSFDPPTQAHYLMASGAVTTLNLDLLLLIPAYRAPLKQAAPASSVEHRLEMLQLLANSVPNAKIDLCEIDKGREVSTWETARQVMAEQGAGDYHLIIGGDQAAQFERWKNWEQLLALVNVILFTRAGYIPSAVLQGKGLEISMEEDISSEKVRSMIKKGEDVSGLLTPEILSYIHRVGLYR